MGADFDKYEGRRSEYMVLVRNSRRRDHLEDLHVNRVILKRIFKKLDEAWTGLIWHKIRADDGRLRTW